MHFWPFKWKQIGLLTLLQLVSRGRGGRRVAEFLGLFTQLHDAKLKLQQASGGMEAQFLATGSELETLSQLGNRFVKQVEKLVGLASGKECDESVFAKSIRLIEQATDFLGGCQKETEQMLGLLRNYNAQVKHLLSIETELQRTMLPLKFVRTLFKAESAPLGQGIQQMFGALTQEIDGLHNQVREIFGTKFNQLEQTQRTIGQVISQLDQQARSLQQVTTTHKARIESTLETLKKEMSSNQQRDVRLGRLSKDMAREVDQIVMGLQFQDIISQKLQHVTAALPQIEAKFNEFSSAPSAVAASEPLQFLHQSCRLEAGQLQAAQEEMGKAEAAIQGGIQQVLAHLTESDSQCLSLEEFKLLTTSFDGMVQVLLETIEEVRKLVATTVTGAEAAYQLLQPLGSLASDLTAVVRDLSARIHLIGLNAQVQAAQAAQALPGRRGAGLEVLSARTSEISEETNCISLRAAAELDALAAGLGEIVSAFGQLRTDGLSEQIVLDEQGRTEEQQLHAFRDSALETLRAIGSSLDDIREQAQRTYATVQFTKFHQVTLPALRAPLVAIADTAEQWLQEHGEGVAHASLIEGFKRDYTMASEREVFTGVMTAGGSLGPPSSCAEPIASPEFELFSDSPAAAPVEPCSPTEVKPETAPIAAALPALAGSPTEQKPETVSLAAAPPVSSSPELGSNIELF